MSARDVIVGVDVGGTFTDTLAEQTAKAASKDMGEAHIGLQSGSLVLCPPRVGGLLFVCGGGEYGRQSVSASGFKSLRQVPTRALFNLIAQGTLRLQLVSWLFVRVSTALLVPLIRQEYVYDSREGDRQLFRTAPVAGRVELGLGMDL